MSEIKAGKEKKEMAPVLQSFTEYIGNHFMDGMLQEIKGAMSLNQVDGLDVDCGGAEIIVDPGGTKLVRAESWRIDRTHLIADCRMKIRFGLSHGGRIPRFMIRFIHFTANVSLDNGITVHKGLRDISTRCFPDRKLTRLTKYLVPVVTYGEMEILVLDMLRRYLGEEKALEKRENGAEELARAMGLSIRYVSLFRNHDTSAMICLKDGTATVVASGACGAGTDDGESMEISVPAGTILININRRYQGDLDREIYHECAHYEWHSMFFELQQLHAADLDLLNYEEATEASLPARKDIGWVERQADFAGIAAMFPRPVFEQLVREKWKDVANLNYNIGRRLALIICRIAADRKKSRSVVRTRMITAGTVEAKGALNYVDGDYIADFAFDTENLSSGETFVIGRGEFTQMYEQDGNFRKLISTRMFIYADGHVCCNHPLFIRKEGRGCFLTDWALGHVDECCMKFTKVYRGTPKHYRIGELHSDQDYNESYLMIHSFEIAGLSEEELMEKNLDYLDTLPRRPSRALSQLIRDRVKTQRGLAAASGISEAKISRMCNNDDYDYSIQDVTRIIIGLQLPPPLSAIFLDMTKFTRAVMVQYLRYQCIIDCLFMEDIQDVVDTHRALFDE